MASTLKCTSINVLKALALIIGLPLLYGGLMFAGGAFTGAGHGSDFFLLAVLAPFGAFEFIAPIGMLLWPVVAVLLVLRRFFACRIAAGIVLAIHYLGLLVVCFQTEWSYVRRVWESFPGMILAFVFAYVASHAFMWTLIKRNKMRPPEGMETPKALPHES